MRHRYMGIMVGIGTVLADDPMLNTRVENLKSPVRIICDSKLRIPLDSQIVKSAKKQQTIIAYSDITYAEEKLKVLQDAGIETVCCLGDDKRIDLNKLMSFIGNKGIDSILLEGGGTLNDSALRAGIVNEVQAFIAPKIFGGASSKSPVEGIGVEVPRDAFKLRCLEVQQIGEDIKIRYKVCMKEEEQCLQGL